jgi:chromosome segregation ATPase
LLDRDRRIFEERDDLTEDVEMLRDEIENMQRTEVQAFRDSLKLRNSEISHLRAEIRRLRRSERRSETQILALRAQIRDIESSTTWRIFEPYRRLRARLDAARRSLPGGGKGNEDRR